MPIQPALQDDPNQNAWLDQATQELNDVQDEVEQLRALIAALTARVAALENQ